MQLAVLTDQRPKRRLPPWLKRPLPAGDFAHTVDVVAASGVATVCQDAKCPNLSECWSKRHATFMILGHKCTRRCHYCAVETARPDPLAEDEPGRLAEAVAQLRLRHVVITAVARDDLKDEGAGHFARCVRAIHAACPETTVEVLPADFHARRECIEILCEAGPELYNHNLEMVERLTPKIRPQGKYRRSLEVLRIVKEVSRRVHLAATSAPADWPRTIPPFQGGTEGGQPDEEQDLLTAPRANPPVSPLSKGGSRDVTPSKILTKSGIMVGLGETTDELHRTFRDLRDVGCDVLTIGQYLQPTLDRHHPVEKFYHPDEFEQLAEYARSLGFISVASGPFVRSSYNAAEVFEESRRRLSPIPPAQT